MKTSVRVMVTATTIAAGTAAFLAAVVLLSGRTLMIVDDVTLVNVPMVAGGLCIRRGRREGQPGWLLLGGGCLSWASGAAVFAWHEIVLDSEPFPSVADLGFLGLYPLAGAGLLFFPATQIWTVSRLRLLLDGMLCACATLFVLWPLVLGPISRVSDLDGTAQTLAMSYPIADVMLIVIALLVLARTAATRIPLTLICGGLICAAIADSTFEVLSLTTGYDSGDVMDVAFLLGYLLVAAAATWPTAAAQETAQEAAQPQTTVPLHRMLLPYLPVAAAMLLAVHQALTGRPMDLLLFWVGLVLVLVLLGRQMLSLLENRALTRQLSASVRELGERERQLQHHALHDALTGLPNRVLLQDRVAGALARAERTCTPVLLLFADLDDFKTVNDTLGHTAGDALLRVVAERLRAGLREGDTPARLGGDEFAVLLADGTDLSAAQRVVERLLAALRTPTPISGQLVAVAASIGVATGTGVTVEELLSRADVAMYAAKADGGGGYQTHDLDQPLLTVAHRSGRPRTAG